MPGLCSGTHACLSELCSGDTRMHACLGSAVGIQLQLTQLYTDPQCQGLAGMVNDTCCVLSSFFCDS